MPYCVVHVHDTMFFDKDPVDLSDFAEKLSSMEAPGPNGWAGARLRRQGDSLLLEAGYCLIVAWTDDESREQLLADLKKHWPDDSTGAVRKLVLQHSYEVRAPAHLSLMCATLEAPVDEQTATVVACRHWGSASEPPRPWQRLNKNDDSPQVLLSALIPQPQQ